MRKLFTVSVISFALLVSLSLVGSYASDVDKAVVKSVTKQADDVAAGKMSEEDLFNAGAKIAKSDAIDGEAYLLMPVFAKRKGAKGGMGVGPAGSVDEESDGIELYLQKNLSEEVSDDDVGKLQPHLIRMAELSAAMATVAYHVPPSKAKSGAKLREWQKWNKDMYKESLALKAALKAKDKAKVKAVTTTLLVSCNECHEKYR